MLSAHSSPVTALKSSPLTDVAIGVNIARPTEPSAPGHISTIDTTSWPVSSWERVPAAFVRTGQPAEAHIITGRT